MIRVSILYPNNAGSRFDFDYYLQTHIPMAQKLLGTALKGLSVERGLMGTTPGSSPAYSAMCFMLFESVEAFLAAFMPHAEALQGDIKNYANVDAIIQFNQVELVR